MARLHALKAKILLFDTHRNSSLHLAKVRSGLCLIIRLDGKRQWITFEEYTYDEDAFPLVKHAFHDSGAIHTGQVESATAQLMTQVALIDFAVQW